MYEIEYTLEARQDLNMFRKFEQKYILDEVEAIGYKRGSKLFIRGQEYQL